MKKYMMSDKRYVGDALEPELGRRSERDNRYRPFFIMNVSYLILLKQNPYNSGINLSYPNKTFSRGQLMDEFWGIDSDIGLGAVYPLYLNITKKQREKLAPRVLEITNELMK